MSIFPTKILLATDGSREAELAASTAADLATTNSELHVVTVAPGNPDPVYHTHEGSFRYETYEEALESVRERRRRCSTSRYTRSKRREGPSKVPTSGRENDGIRPSSIWLRSWAPG
jgi:nucleotide-binding universal stress UspA family protein